MPPDRTQPRARLSFPGHFTRRVPAGDDHPRAICDRCGFIAYENPRIVVGSVATIDGGTPRILLCRRAIEPGYGLWTLPAGFLEHSESPSEGACREAREEAGADLVLQQLLSIYALSHIGQVQLFWRAQIANPEGLAAGRESLEIGLFEYDESRRLDLGVGAVIEALSLSALAVLA